MSLQTLLEGWCDSVPAVVIKGMGLDSRSHEPGQAFIAVAGASTHGMEHAHRPRRGRQVMIHDGLAPVPALTIPAVAVPGLGSGFPAWLRVSFMRRQTSWQSRA